MVHKHLKRFFVSLLDLVVLCLGGRRDVRGEPTNESDEAGARRGCLEAREHRLLGLLDLCLLLPE